MTAEESAKLRQDLADRYGSELLFVDGPEMDYAIVGVSSEQRVVYDAMTIVEILMETSEPPMTREEAHEYADFNIFQAFMGEHTPIYVWIEDDEFDEAAELQQY